MEIQDLSRNPPSRTPFSEAAQKDKSEGGADFSPVNGPTKEEKRKEKTKKKKGKEGKEERGWGNK